MVSPQLLGIGSAGLNLMVVLCHISTTLLVVFNSGSLVAGSPTRAGMVLPSCQTLLVNVLSKVNSQ